MSACRVTPPPSPLGEERRKTVRQGALSPSDQWKMRLRDNCLAAARRSRAQLTQKSRRSFAARLISAFSSSSPSEDAPLDFSGRTSSASSPECTDDDEPLQSPSRLYFSSPPQSHSSPRRRGRGRGWGPFSDDDPDSCYDLSKDEYLELLLQIESELMGENASDQRHSGPPEDGDLLFYEQLRDEEERHLEDLVAQVDIQNRSPSSLPCPVCRLGRISFDSASMIARCSGRCAFRLRGNNNDFLSRIQRALESTVERHDSVRCFNPIEFSIRFTFVGDRKESILWAACRSCSLSEQVIE